MSWLRSFTSALFTATVLAAAYWAFYLPVQARQEALEHKATALEMDITALQSRVTGLSGSGPAQIFPKELVWEAEDKADAELALQDAAVNLAGQFDVTLITFGTSALKRDTAQGMMAFEFEIEGPLGAIHAFLAALEELNPKTAVGMLRMRPAQGHGNVTIKDVLIYSQITLWAFWGNPS
jgi:hypothetical protein